ncbi:MAG: hypothetical protein JXR96_04075 [Deltaproteobacteria bacterium]|nr:hypothetical protein [Deltaproteobacteria bacterium]
MRLEEVQRILEARPAWTVRLPRNGEREVVSCLATDLMSDALTTTGEGSLLLTGLTNSQVIRTAGIVDLAAICFVRGKSPQPETVELAEKMGVRLLVTDLSMFEACGRLYEKGLRAAVGDEGDCRTRE